MTFNQHTDQWFDNMVEYVARHPDEAKNLLRTVSLKPTRNNVRQLKEVVSGLQSNSERYYPCLPLLLNHINQVLNQGFKGEFRFSFGEVTASESFSTGYMKVSAASELFNMVKQALAY